MQLEELVEKYDAVLVGDGSGVAEEGGWCVFVFLKDAEPFVLAGGCTRSTVNVMELVGYIHALSILQRMEKAPKKVLVLSDSRITVKCASGAFHAKANLPWWAALDQLRTEMLIDFVEVERCSFPVALWAHDGANKFRQAARALHAELFQALRDSWNPDKRTALFSD